MVFAQFTERPLRCLMPIQSVLLLWNLGLLPIWGDEQSTLGIVALPWRDVGSALAADIHPPLYFVALKVWMTFAWLEPIVWARLFSALIALCSTLALDRLWLQRIPAEARAWFLALWCLSPLLLLDARMARSYSLQTLFAVVALAAMARVCAAPTWRRATLLAIAIDALLYTHYLPGLAVGAVSIGALARKNVRLAVGSALLALLLYAPWLPVLLDGLQKAAVRDAYRLAPSVFTEAALRIGYWFTAFSFGEAHHWITLALAVLLAPLLIRLTLRGAAGDNSGFVQAGLLAAPVGLLGTWRWVAFAFTPTRLLFLLPAYLLSLSLGVRENLDRCVLLAVLSLNLTGIAFYFTQYGFLNPGYLIPYGEIAHQIEQYRPAGGTLVLVDAFNGDPKPLLAALDPEYVILVAESNAFIEEANAVWLNRKPQTIWSLGSPRDVSPGRLHEVVKERLIADYQLAEATEYLPYNSLQRRLFELFSPDQAPAAHFVAQRWERRAIQ